MKILQVEPKQGGMINEDIHHLHGNKIQQSFSRVGKLGDNTWSESFFANLKKEAVHWRHFKTRTGARQTIFACIGSFTTPAGFRKDWIILALWWLRRWEYEDLQQCLANCPKYC